MRASVVPLPRVVDPSEDVSPTVASLLDASPELEVVDDAVAVPELLPASLLETSASVAGAVEVSVGPLDASVLVDVVVEA
jgi:hypothetical protein